MHAARLFRAALLALLAAASCAAWAQAYPTKPVTYLVTFDPGGQSDREARRQQPHLERLLGQKILIDYKVGGGGALGWRELVKSKPDGYVMAGINIPHIILQPLQQEVGYKTEQIVPVAFFQRTPLGLAVLESSPFKTLQEFLDYAKKNPDALTIGGSGTFSGHHMASLRFEKLSGGKFTYVPFTGAAPQTMAFLGGHVAAKRYLLTTDPAYAALLSARSEETLGFQGGLMTPREVDRIEMPTLLRTRGMSSRPT